jgi:cell division protein FtsB
MEWVARVLGSAFVYWPMCLVGCALVALAVLGPEARRRIQIEHHCQVMEAEVESLRETHDQLTATANALETDPAYAERVVRHDLNIVRPGETPLPGPAGLRPPRDAETTLEWQVPPVIALASPWADPPWRFGALAAGGVLLVAAVIFSLPGRAKRAAR